MTSFKTIYAPSSVGREAFVDLDRVAWGELAHAYGAGKVGPELSDDRAATPRRSPGIPRGSSRSVVEICDEC